MAVGQLFALCFDATEPSLLATAGSKGVLALWDFAEDIAFMRRDLPMADDL